MSAMSIINFVAFALGIFASYLLLIKSLTHPNIAHKLLSLIIFSFSWILLVATFNFFKINITFPNLFQTALPLCFIIPPASYLYVCSFLKPERGFKTIDLFHFIPSISLLLSIIPSYLHSDETKNVLEPNLVEQNIMFSFGIEVASSLWIYGLIATSFGVYLLLQIFTIYRQLKNNTYPKNLEINEPKQKWLLAFTVFLFLLSLTYLWVFAIGIKTENAYPDGASIIGVTFLIFMIFLYQKPEILYNLGKLNEVKETPEEYIPFNAKQLKNYCQQVLHFIETEEPFLQCGYSLENLANDTCISRSHLSIVLNKGLGMKYNDLINKYRIEYLIHHYTEVNKQNLTVEGIATNVGFKSRTTFLHSVKKITGLTPSEFLRKLEENVFIVQRSLFER